MKKVYFDDLFLILTDTCYLLCLHNPYEQHDVLLNVSLDSSEKEASEIIHAVLNTQAFQDLGITVLGIPHRLTQGK